jgi:DNA-binding MarR family transcriptional regulator
VKVVSLPRSAIVVLDEIYREGPISPKDIAKKAELAPRTISYALRSLCEINLCKKLPNLRDMRQPLYYANRDRIKELQIDLGRLIAETRVYLKIV